MRNPFSRMFSHLSAHVCPNCEGGAGAFFNADTGELTRCMTCSGSGLESSVAMSPVIDLALVRTVRAKKQRRVA